VVVILDSGVDVSTLSHALVVTPGRHAKITVTVNRHPGMLDPLLVTPTESIDCHEVVNCIRVYLQDRQRRGLTVAKAEVTIPGDFEDMFVQPVRQASSSDSCRYRAARVSSPFRISYVAGTSNNHTQGVVLTSYLLYKLKRARNPNSAVPCRSRTVRRETVDSMLTQHHCDLPATRPPAASSTPASLSNEASRRSTHRYSLPPSQR
jgi:hypothetical protein